MAAHATYGGSTMERTKKCSSWVEFCKNLPSGGSNSFADEGTLLHNAMEKIYTESSDFNSRSVIGMTYEGETLTEELYKSKIIPAINAVELVFEKYNVDEDGFLCESRVEIAEDTWGWSDLLAVGSIEIEGETFKVALCLDYKFGFNIVDPVENSQGLFYSVAAAETEETKHFFAGIDLLAVGIIQPNDRGLEVAPIWEISADRLVGERITIVEAVKVSKGPNTEFVPGDHCKYCPGNGLCPPTSGAVSALKRLDVTAPDLIKNIPSFDELKEVEATIKAIRGLVYSQLEEGVEIPGFKLVAGKRSQSYTSIEDVKAVVKRSKKIKAEEAYASKLLTPPQMRTLCKKKGLDYEKLFGDLTSVVSSGTTLASSDDKRKQAPSIGALAALLDRDK